MLRELTRDLEPVLAARSMDLSRLCQRAEAVIVFGSRAAGCPRPESDWDLLCVGPNRTHRDPGLDVVWVSSERLDDWAWLTSELAGHVAHWGILVAGEAPWRDQIRDAQAKLRKQADGASSYKRRLIHGQARGLQRVWSYLDKPRLHAELHSLRRELQRYEELRHGRPVPPTAHLDMKWALDAGPERWVEFCSAAVLEWIDDELCEAIASWLRAESSARAGAG